MDNKSDVEKALEDLFGESLDEEEVKREKPVFSDGKDKVIVPVFTDKDDNVLENKKNDINEDMIDSLIRDNALDEEMFDISINNDNEIKKEIINNETKEDNIATNNIIDNSIKENNELREENINNEAKEDSVIDAKELNNSIIEDKKDLPISNNLGMKKSTDAKNKVSKDKNNNSIKIDFSKLNTKFVFLGVVALIFIIFIAVILYNTNKESKVSCSYDATDTGYKTHDEYLISHRSNNITYIHGTYTYTAKTDEFKNQINVIKEEKIPVIVNSNGMKGFTHTYEISDNQISVYSYYDFTKIDFKKVDKNDDKITPISYISFKSTTTYDKLIKNLKKSGYKCTNSK